MKRKIILPTIGGENGQAVKRARKEESPLKISRFKYHHELLKASSLKTEFITKLENGKVRIKIDQENVEDALSELEKNANILNEVWLNTALKQNQFKSLLDTIKCKDKISKISITGCQAFKWTKELVNWLKENPYLTALKIENGHLTSEDAIELALALENNINLISLNLSVNEIKNEGLESIIEALKKNINITSLNLSFNNIKDRGLSAIADLLKANPKLSKLNLSGNHIKLEKANKFIELFSEDCNLAVLNLSGNPISSGLDSFAKALHGNNSLTHLALPFYSNEIRALLGIIERNKSLVSLEFPDSHYEDINFEVLQDFVTSLNKNLHIKTFDLKASNDFRNSIDAKLKINQEYFEAVINVIKNPCSYNDDGNVISLNINAGHCKFFQEAAESLFHQPLGTDYSALLNNFKTIALLTFFYQSGVCTARHPLPIPDDLLLSILKPNLKFGDISWSFETKAANSNGPSPLEAIDSTAVGLNDSFEA